MVVQRKNLANQRKIHNRSSRGMNCMHRVCFLSFQLTNGEALEIAGLLGAGRTELLKFIFGVLPLEYTGKLLFRGKEYRPRSARRSIQNKIVYLSEDRKNEGIFPDLSVLVNSSISVLDRFARHRLLNSGREKKAVSETKRLRRARQRMLARARARSPA